jgi:hypothetical protein
MVERLGDRYNPPLQVVGFIASRKGDPERGPLIRMSSNEAKIRMLQDGELVWVHGPRRHELASFEIDDSIPRGGAVVRDIAGLAVSEIIRVTKPDVDLGGKRDTLA